MLGEQLVRLNRIVREKGLTINSSKSAVLVPAGRGISEYWRKFEEVGVYKYMGVLFGRGSGRILFYNDRTKKARQM